jgi:ABC-type Fe2+-enterobactin transport system substrate-binding protein
MLSHRQIRNLEQRFGVFLGTRDDTVNVYGEEGNVRRCISELEDMRDEIEESMKLPTEQIRALMVHDNAYRRQIESQSGAFIRLNNMEGIVLVGGKNAVRQCERAINDLFKSAGGWEK